MRLKALSSGAAALLVVSSVIMIAQAPAPPPAGADPPQPIFWSAAQMKEIDAGLSGRVDPAANMAAGRLIASANVIYRTGPSEAEVHEKQGDLILIREGEGAIVVGGKIVGGKTTRPDEIRGPSIEGGTRYNVATGDTLYVPVNTPHQFFVEKGKHFAITIVKLNPQK